MRTLGAAAANDGQINCMRPADNLLLFYVNQRADYTLNPVFRAHVRAHPCKGAGEKLIQKQRFYKVVQVMSQGDFIAFKALCQRVERPRRKRAQNAQ